MRLILYALIAWMVVVHLGWFAIWVAMSGFDSYTDAANINPSTTFLSGIYMDYIIRTIAGIGAVLLVLYSDRHPLYKGGAFGSFVGTTIITFSWFSISLPWVFSMFDTHSTASSYNYQFCQAAPAPGTGSLNGWCMLGYAAAVMSVCSVAGTLALWFYSLYQMGRATSTVKLSGTERTIHILTWIGLAFYLCWTCASIELAQDPLSTDYNGLLGIWAYGYLHGAVAFALTASAVVSMGADQAFRTAAFFLNTLLFWTLLPGAIYIARITVYGGIPNNGTNVCLGENMNGTCPAQQAIAAGMIGVASAACLLMLLTLGMAFLRTVPEYAAGVNQGGVKTVEENDGMYNNNAAVVDTPQVSTTGQYAV